MFRETPMYGYKVFYNTETHRFETEKEKTLITYEGVNHWFENFESAENNARMCNEQLAKGKLAIIVCSDCGAIFEMDYDEVSWYDNKGFTLPKRCYNCRKERKYGSK